MSAGSQPGRRGSAVALIQMVCSGGLMLATVSSRAARSLCSAGLASAAWGPHPGTAATCRAPALSAASLRRPMAFSVPL
eukprot:1372146-Lingulodinium_polyedra.AAC.1